jgi:hypothetical protein
VRGAGFDPTGGYAGPVLDNYRFGDLGLYLAGQQQPRPGARVPLLGCECGEWGCWPLLATVTIADGIAEWSDFGQPHRPERDYSRFGPLRFVEADYRAAVASVASVSRNAGAGQAQVVLGEVQGRDLGRVRRVGPRRSRRVDAARRPVLLADQRVRKQRDNGALEALGKTKGRPPVDPVERENTPLQARVAKLEAELDTSRRVIEVHGKLSALLEQLATGGATDERPAK